MPRLVQVARLVRIVRIVMIAVVAVAMAADARLVRLGDVPGLFRPGTAGVLGSIQAAPPRPPASSAAGTPRDQEAPVRTADATGAASREDGRAVDGFPASELVYPAWVDADQALEAYLAAYPVPTPTPWPTPDLTASSRVAPRPAAPLISSGPRTRPRVAITIDDTLRAGSIRADHEFFMQERVNVTWFPIGKAIAANAALWREIATAGFPIANHTWNHVDATTQTQAQIEWEINAQAAAVLQHTGRTGAPFFRPMGGSWNANVLRAAGATGMAYVVLWEPTSGDTGRGPVELVIANAMRAQAGSIILFHANEERSDIAIRQVVTDLRAKGYELVTLGQLLGVPGPVPFPAPPPPDAAATPTPTPPSPPLFIPVPPAAPTASPSPAPAP